MAVTVVVKQAFERERELSLTLDAPRLVIGRGRSCEIQLPDPTVSARHASLRIDGGRCVIVDESSTNGVVFSGNRLPPHTPQTVCDGDIVRIGRVWLELRFGACAPERLSGSPSRRAKAFAMDVLSERLAGEGEAVAPYLLVVDGPDGGARLLLDDSEREYVLGRSRDSDMVLSDELVSRRHVTLQRDAGEWRVRDHGSKRGSQLDDEPLCTSGTTWSDGQFLRIGSTLVELRAPLVETFEELMQAPDVRMRAGEHAEPPPGQASEPEPEHAESEAEADLPDDDESEAPPSVDTPDHVADALVELVQPNSRGYVVADVFVVLMALGLLSVSAAGLWWVLA